MIEGKRWKSSAQTDGSHLPQVIANRKTIRIYASSTLSRHFDLSTKSKKKNESKTRGEGAK